MKQFTAEAKLKHGDKVVSGGVCEFFNPKTKEKVTFMLHKNDEGRITVSEIDRSTIRGVFDCWAWITDWAMAFEESTGDTSGKRFLEWIQKQPGTPA